MNPTGRQICQLSRNEWIDRPPGFTLQICEMRSTVRISQTIFCSFSYSLPKHQRKKSQAAVNLGRVLHFRWWIYYFFIFNVLFYHNLRASRSSLSFPLCPSFVSAVVCMCARKPLICGPRDWWKCDSSVVFRGVYRAVYVIAYEYSFSTTIFEYLIWNEYFKALLFLPFFSDPSFRWYENAGAEENVNSVDAFHFPLRGPFFALLCLALLHSLNWTA